MEAARYVEAQQKIRNVVLASAAAEASLTRFDRSLVMTCICVPVLANSMRSAATSRSMRAAA